MDHVSLLTRQRYFFALAMATSVEEASVAREGECTMSSQPMAEVFGFSIDDMSERAKRHRQNRICPFNNKVPNCTKDKANDPLGVCSVFGSDGDEAVITCPVRFREDWVIADDVAEFFFTPNSRWTTLTEIRLKDKAGASAGNIDLVVVEYDANGRIIDFGSCEIQAVYISGNIRNPFAYYMEEPEARKSMDWSTQLHYPRPDFLSSSRKRLAPQLLYKGGIMSAWGKKQAVVLDRPFFDTLPTLPRVEKEEADFAWFIYDLKPDESTGRLKLVRDEIIYAAFEPTMLKVTTAEAGPLEEFVVGLQAKLDEKLSSTPPDAPALNDLLRNESPD